MRCLRGVAAPSGLLAGSRLLELGTTQVLFTTSNTDTCTYCRTAPNAAKTIDFAGNSSFACANCALVSVGVLPKSVSPNAAPVARRANVVRMPASPSPSPTPSSATADTGSNTAAASGTGSRVARPNAALAASQAASPRGATAGATATAAPAAVDKTRGRSNSDPEPVSDSSLLAAYAGELPVDMQTLDSRLKDKFYLNMNREQAEKKLAGRLPGTFVVRRREKLSMRVAQDSKQFAISFVDRKTLQVGHSVVTYDAALKTYTMEGSPKEFDTLVSVLETYHFIKPVDLATVARMVEYSKAQQEQFNQKFGQLVKETERQAELKPDAAAPAAGGAAGAAPASAGSRKIVRSTPKRAGLANQAPQQAATVARGSNIGRGFSDDGVKSMERRAQPVAYEQLPPTDAGNKKVVIQYGELPDSPAIRAELLQDDTEPLPPRRASAPRRSNELSASASPTTTPPARNSGGNANTAVRPTSPGVPASPASPSPPPTDMQTRSMSPPRRSSPVPGAAAAGAAARLPSRQQQQQLPPPPLAQSQAIQQQYPTLAQMAAQPQPAAANAARPVGNVSAQDPLARFPWFHGKLNARAANALVQNQRVGTFLVRESSQPGCYAIASTRPDGSVCHTLVNCINNNQYAYDGQDLSLLPAFNALHELIDHLIVNGLTHPLTRAGFQAASS